LTLEGEQNGRITKTEKWKRLKNLDSTGFFKNFQKTRDTGEFIKTVNPYYQNKS